MLFRNNHNEKTRKQSKEIKFQFFVHFFLYIFLKKNPMETNKKITILLTKENVECYKNHVVEFVIVVV